ncbi:VMAP-C domain-containing protein [Kitasatospora purpeofusca]|uniref:VMAP-C domain-containing protein n=1 Tax=Kitasatospora purpeofusca TaxID=67352 RepID=UPI0036C57CF2
MHATPFVPPAGDRGPWPEGAEGVLLKIIFFFDQMYEFTFRQDVLGIMNASPKSLGIKAGIRADFTPNSHVREILRAIRTSRDPWTALDSLAEALEELAPKRRAGEWLKLVLKVLKSGDDLPCGELLQVIFELSVIEEPTAPARHLPEDIPGVQERDTARMNLPEILDLLVSRIDDNLLGPLVVFLRALGDHLEATRKQPLPVLRRFLAAHADRAPAPAAGPRQRLIVQIRLDEESSPDTGDPLYRLIVAYYRQPLAGGQFWRVGRHRDEERFTRSELFASGGGRLTAWEQLRLALLDPTAPVRIEFLLPRSLLGYAAELWSTGTADRHLGQQHPVVVRQLERYFDYNLDRSEWRKRWKYLGTHGADPTEVLERIGWPPLGPADADGLADWIFDQHELSCMGLDVPYEQLDPAMQRAVDDAMYLDGVPVLLWRRVAGGKETLLKDLRKHEPTRLAELPYTVLKHRRRVRNPTPAPDRTLTLVWDDPDCVDPDQDYPYEGMAE